MLDTVTMLEYVMADSDSVQVKTALSIAIDAVKKQTAPNVRRSFKCPTCGSTITMFDHYCRECGQKLPRWEGWS
jgi:predicted RNA-binding Zn-ribbon protein involved in translation (DUF1610 family)